MRKPHQGPWKDSHSLPYNVEMEQALLGAILQDNDRYWQVSEILKPIIFYDPLHRRILNAVSARIERGEKANPFTIYSDMRDDPGFKEITVGGHEYLESMALAVEVLPPVDDYVVILRELAQRRAVIYIADDAAEDAYKSGTEAPIEPIIKFAMERLYDVVHDPNLGQGPQPSDVMFEASLREAEQTAQAPEQARISTGVRSIDEKLGGFFPGHLYVLAAPPSVGKSGLVAQFAMHSAKAGHFTEIYTLEMSGPDITTRYLAADVGIPVSAIAEGRISVGDVEQMANARRDYPHTLPLFIDSRSGATVSDIRTSAQTVRHRYGNLDFLVVDHLRLIRPDEPRAMEHERLDQTTRDLKAIAIDFHIPVLLVVTMNREFWKRPSKRPIMSDIYGASAIEYNADHVWFLHRPEFFLERDEPPREHEKEYAQWERDYEASRGKAELFSVKRRNGPLGSVVLRFDAPFIRFSEL